jgi:hypothetical protein
MTEQATRELGLMTSGTVSTTDQTRQVVEAFYQAAIRRDRQSVLDSLADDVVFHEPSFLPYGGSYRGRDGFIDMASKIAEVLDTSKITLVQLAVDGDVAFAVMELRDRRSGDDVLFVERSRIRNGKISEVTLFFHEARSLITADSGDQGHTTG